MARFNAAEARRRDLGDVTLVDVTKSLADEKPPISQALQLVAPIPTKHQTAAEKRSKYNN